jgi:hypothetical protein
MLPSGGFSPKLTDQHRCHTPRTGRKLSAPLLVASAWQGLGQAAHHDGGVVVSCCPRVGGKRHGIAVAGGLCLVFPS